MVGAVAGMIAATVVAAPAVSSAPGDGVSIRPVSLTVDGETATGRVYEPEGGARGLIVAVHGHDGSASDFPEYMSSIVKQTGAALISMDQRSDDSVWRTGSGTCGPGGGTRWPPRGGIAEIIPAARRCCGAGVRAG